MIQQNNVLRTLGYLVLTIILLSSTSSVEARDKSKKRQKKEEQAQQIQRQSYVPGDRWEAYFRDENGLTYKLLHPVEQNTDKDWLGLQFTEFLGPRSRIAVMEVENEIPHNPKSVTRRVRNWLSTNVEVPLSAIEELLTSAIFNTNRFEVIERKELQTVISEQKLGATGRITEQTAVKIGRLLGLQHMLFTAVNEWNPRKKSVEVAGSKRKAEVTMSFRIVEVETGRISFAETFRATADNWQVGLPLVFGMTKKSPINYAVVSCINKAAYGIAMSLKDILASGSVVQVDGDVVTISLGSNQGMRMGIVLTALAKGKELINPETGESLGADTEVIGSLQVTTVREKYSKAVILEGCRGIKVGDKVEFQAGDN